MRFFEFARDRTESASTCDIDTNTVVLSVADQNILLAPHRAAIAVVKLPKQTKHYMTKILKVFL